ncbi:MAG: sigma-70 family RNA polymerase sigma factor [Planctomycetes bacterium]|nr:sigma-70 family RNA polymerase sigma factor [Planctomycetota bacterium]
MTSEPSLPIEQLLAEADWIGRLARVLVRDPAMADDVVQATWVDVLRSPPRHALRLRQWLAAIVRRKAQRVARTAARRERREQQAVAHATVEAPSAVDLVARVTTHRELVDAVLALDEPFRATVVLRYFENLGIEAIAERQQTRANTVRSRLQRGLKELRERLDRAHGGRERWLPAVLALGGRELALEGLGTGGMAAGVALALSMKKLASVVAALIAAVLLTCYWPSPDAAATAPPEPPLAGVPKADAKEPPAPSGKATAEPTRIAAAGSIGLPPRADRQVVDPAGNALAGVVMRAESPHAVRWQGGDRGWIAGADRTVRIDAGTEERLLADAAFAAQFFADFAHPDEWRATVLGTPLPSREAASDERGGFELPAGLDVVDADVAVGDPRFVLVAAGARAGKPWIASPATRATGTVRNDEGKVLADVFVMPLGVTGDGQVELPRQLEARTDDDGTFLVRKAATSGVLRVRREGYTTALVPLADRPRQHLDVVLHRSNPSARSLLGLVVDGGGQPIAGAAVWFGRQQTTTAADGRFRFPIDNPARQYALTIVAKGFALLQHDELGAALADPALAEQERLYVLGRKPLTARGVVLGSDGAPLAGALVALLDPTLLDISFEGVEARVGGWSGGVATGPDGTFTLAGLAERPYRFGAVDPATGAIATSAPHRAEAGDLVLRLPRDLRLAVRGTVKRDGRPATNATVEVGYCTHVTKGGGTRFDSAPAVVCDASGRFVLPKLPRNDAWLVVRIDGSVRHMVPVERLALGPELDIDIDGTRWLQLVGSAFPVDRSIHFERQDGSVQAAAGTLSAQGRAPALALPHDAVAVVVDHGGPHPKRLLLTDDRAVLLRVR